MPLQQKYIADLHVHSHFSRATSRFLTPEHLDQKARGKGIKVIGTGDVTHPGWLAELKEKLQPAGEGLFRLRPEWRLEQNEIPSGAPGDEVLFMLTGEISTIFKKNGTLRKVHCLVCLPDFPTAERIQKDLEGRGNITADGRPILGMEARDLFDLCLNASERIMFIPAHIWTPWFSMLGSRSGFDDPGDCFEELTPLLAAVEMGLSTDPAMNWRCSFLDDFSLLASSDAHSPEKLGRNATLLATDLTYPAIRDAIVNGSEGLLGTISFFPQEGKYYLDGHRKCRVKLTPEETSRHEGICPICGKPLTIGVANRVMQLADRSDGIRRVNRKASYSLIPLKEILSELLAVGAGSKKVNFAYRRIIQRSGPELSLLMDVPLADIEMNWGDALSEAVRRMRSGNVHVEPGYDGQYGRIRVFGENEIPAAMSMD